MNVFFFLCAKIGHVMCYRLWPCNSRKYDTFQDKTSTLSGILSNCENKRVRSNLKFIQITKYDLIIHYESSTVNCLSCKCRLKNKRKRKSFIRWILNRYMNIV